MHGSLSIASPKANIRVAKGVTRKIGENKIPFRVLAVLVWPRKTAFELAALTGASDRTAKRWLAGDGCTPWSAVAVVLGEIIRRLD